MGRWILVTLSLITSSASGEAQELDFLVSPGELSLAHSELSGLKNCSSCHDSGSGLSPEKCLACHENKPGMVKQWQDSKHFEAGVGCYECHKAEEGDVDAMDHNTMQKPVTS